MNRNYKQHFNREMVERIKKGDYAIWDKATRMYANDLYRKEVNYLNERIRLDSQLIYLN